MRKVGKLIILVVLLGMVFPSWARAHGKGRGKLVDLGADPTKIEVEWVKELPPAWAYETAWSVGGEHFVLSNHVYDKDGRRVGNWWDRLRYQMAYGEKYLHVERVREMDGTWTYKINLGDLATHKEKVLYVVERLDVDKVGMKPDGSKLWFTWTEKVREEKGGKRILRYKTYLRIVNLSDWKEMEIELPGSKEKPQCTPGPWCPDEIWRDANAYGYTMEDTVLIEDPVLDKTFLYDPYTRKKIVDGVASAPYVINGRSYVSTRRLKKRIDRRGRTIWAWDYIDGKGKMIFKNAEWEWSSPDEKEFENAMVFPNLKLFLYVKQRALKGNFDDDDVVIKLTYFVSDRNVIKKKKIFEYIIDFGKNPSYRCESISPQGDRVLIENTSGKSYLIKLRRVR